MVRHGRLAVLVVIYAVVILSGVVGTGGVAPVSPPSGMVDAPLLAFLLLGKPGQPDPGHKPLLVH